MTRLSIYTRSSDLMLETVVRMVMQMNVCKTKQGESMTSTAISVVDIDHALEASSANYPSPDRHPVAVYLVQARQPNTVRY